MDDLSFPAPESDAQRSSDFGGEAISADRDADLRPLETAPQLLAGALVAALDPAGLPRRLAALVAAATSAEQVLIWAADDLGSVQLGTPLVLSTSDLDAARKRASRVLKQGKPVREQLPGGLAVTLPLGLEPLGALEARFGSGTQANNGELAALQPLAISSWSWSERRRSSPSAVRPCRSSRSSRCSTPP